MDEALARDPLAQWGLGTLHAALFLAAFVLALQQVGTLGALLGGLDTLRGLALFAALWLVSVWTTRQALRDLPVPARPGVLVGRGVFWGGATGVGFLLALLLLVVLPELLHSGLDALLAVVFIAGFGSIVAMGVGGIVGLVFTLLDLALVAGARRLLRA